MGTQERRHQVAYWQQEERHRSADRNVLGWEQPEHVYGPGEKTRWGTQKRQRLEDEARHSNEGLEVGVSQPSWHGPEIGITWESGTPEEKEVKFMNTKLGTKMYAYVSVRIRKSFTRKFLKNVYADKYHNRKTQKNNICLLINCLIHPYNTFRKRMLLLCVLFC